MSDTYVNGQIQQAIEDASAIVTAAILSAQSKAQWDEIKVGALRTVLHSLIVAGQQADKLDEPAHHNSSVEDIASWLVDIHNILNLRKI